MHDQFFELIDTRLKNFVFCPSVIFIQMLAHILQIDLQLLKPCLPSTWSPTYYTSWYEKLQCTWLQEEKEASTLENKAEKDDEMSLNSHKDQDILKLILEAEEKVVASRNKLAAVLPVPSIERKNVINLAFTFFASGSGINAVIPTPKLTVAEPKKTNSLFDMEFDSPDLFLLPASLPTNTRVTYPSLFDLADPLPINIPSIFDELTTSLCVNGKTPD